MGATFCERRKLQQAAPLLTAAASPVPMQVACAPGLMSWSRLARVLLCARLSPRPPGHFLPAHASPLNCSAPSRAPWLQGRLLDQLAGLWAQLGGGLRIVHQPGQRRVRRRPRVPRQHHQLPQRDRGRRRRAESLPRGAHRAAQPGAVSSGRPRRLSCSSCCPGCRIMWLGPARAWCASACCLRACLRSWRAPRAPAVVAGVLEAWTVRLLAAATPAAAPQPSTHPHHCHRNPPGPHPRPTLSKVRGDRRGSVHPRRIRGHVWLLAVQQHPGQPHMGAPA